MFWIMKPQLRNRALCRMWRHAGKISCSVLICHFGGNIEVCRIFFEKTSSEQTCKIGYSSKDLTIFLGYGGAPLRHLHATWENHSVIFYP